MRVCGHFLRRGDIRNGTRCRGKVGPKRQFCRLPRAYGPCATVYSRYYYDIEKGCTRFSYSGCYGNENNFKTEAECIKKCGCPPRRKPWRE
uniref:BPTI/Kunitz inhibitor domain-containing protein n=1 Tax=Amblyomma maculatum TaxID=34609 RepID=G3MPG4_AMBMU